MRASAALRSKFLEVTGETKHLLNRISAENTRSMGRAIAKPAYACPGVVFEKALKTAEQYPNMIDPLVECCRYLTYLGYDCLNWTLISSFREDRQVIQGNGMLTKPWLKNAAIFIGKAYRRYTLMDPTPILQFVADQLLRGKLFMLEILEQLITSMAGIGPVLALTESQVQGMSAGPLLRAYTLEHYLGDKRHLTKGHGKRLLKSLKDVGLAPQILVALAVELERFIYRPELEDEPLKVLSTNLDNLHSNFAQYLEFLRSNLSTHEFDALIPGVVELMTDYGVSHGIAFTICRPSLARLVNAARAEARASILKTQSELAAVPKQQQASVPASAKTNGDVIMTGSEESPVIDGAPVESEHDTKGGHLSGQDTDMKEEVVEDLEMKDSPAAAKSPAPSPIGRLNPEIHAVADELKAKMPNIYGDHICLSFFVTFWQLSLVDIFTVTSMKDLNEYNAASRFFSEKATRVPFDRRDVSTQAVEKRRAEIQGYNEQSAAFRTEANDTYEAAVRTREHLREEMHKWFEGIPMVDARSEELHDSILQDCFLPRILLSTQDAHFASAMLKFMHVLGVPGFRTMKFLDQLFKHKMLTGIFFMCSARESQNLGRFLNDVLKELSTWHATQANYTRLAQGQKKSLPGFGRTFNPDRTPSSFLDYEDFRRVLFKWHTQLFRALESCLKSNEYMHIRNAINIMKAIAPNFPRIDVMGKGLQQTIQSLSQNDSRDDLKLSALSLLGDFRKNEKHWISPQAFHHTRNAPNAANATTSRTGSEQPKTPQPPESLVKLSATAPEFNPGGPNTNGSSRPPIDSGSVRDSEGEKEKQAVPISASVHKQDQDTSEPALAPDQAPPPSQRKDFEPRTRGNSQDMNSSAVIDAQTGVTGRPDSRGYQTPQTPSNRPPHILPPRPDGQPSRARPSDRPGDRQPEHNGYVRNDVRNNATPDYGRHERPGDRDSFVERRERSPARGPARGRTPPDRGPGWGGREREVRDYHEDRPMRPPPRDVRGPPPNYPPRDSRDIRDSRDPRDRAEPRGPPLNADGRARMHSGLPPASDQAGHYRREIPPKIPLNDDRNSALPPRALMDRPPTNAMSPALDRPGVGSERPLMNPERAALIDNDDRGRPEAFRSDMDRDNRRDRGPRAQSPQRNDHRVPPYMARNEPPRDHRDPRDDRQPHGRTPPHPFPTNRDRRDEPTGGAPTGPRGGRNDNRVSRESFMSTPQGPRASSHQAQDPNYGRLNPPSDTIPSGPRSLASERRDSGRREPEQAHPSQPPPLPATAPVANQAGGVGIHPSRMNNISNARGPPLQTDVAVVPSGPRHPTRTPQGPPVVSPSSNRGPPTGPASGDRNPRNRDRNAIGAINNLLSQNATVNPEGSGERNNSNQSPQLQVRGRGAAAAAARANGFNDQAGTSSPAGPYSHTSIPNALRPGDDRIQDDGRQDMRVHRDHNRERETRRNDRSGRERSRSPDRIDRKPDERSIRTGPPQDRGFRNTEQERPGDRDRAAGRDKRPTDRDSSRRDRGDRERREGRERVREDDGRVDPRINDPRVVDTRLRPNDRRRDEPRDNRMNGRKRDRPEDLAPHGDNKRTRH